MDFLLLIFPLTISVIVALVAHSLIPHFWRACRRSSLLFALVMQVLVVALHTVDKAPLTVADLGRYLLVATGYGLTGFGIAALVGIPFYFDRQIQQRDQERSR
jgi:hypothetical protein